MRTFGLVTHLLAHRSCSPLFHIDRCFPSELSFFFSLVLFSWFVCLFGGAGCVALLADALDFTSGGTGSPSSIPNFPPVLHIPNDWGLGAGP